MVKRIASFGAVSFVLLAACGAVCQNAGQSLPDAPSVQAATRAPSFNGFVEEAHSPLTFGAMGGHAGVIREGAFAAPDNSVFGRRHSNTILGNYLYPSSSSSSSLSLPKQQPGYNGSSGGSLIGRATYAASRTFVTRNDSGKGRLNTSYLLRALTSVAADTASRPYWKRSFAEPFSDFGSTVGNDAGVNLLHEFGPGLQHLVKSHAPKFLSEIEKRILHN
jgi:hypothetical protein